jgi:restriction system protein
LAERHTTNVTAAFDILLEAVEEEIGFVDAAISTAAGQQDYPKVRENTDLAEKMTEFRSRLTGLRDEWESSYASSADAGTDDEVQRVHRDLGRLQRGLRTPDSAYRQPLLESLEEMGGSGKTAPVVDRVGEKMKHILSDVDYERLQSPPHDIRWRNTVQWARYDLVQRGLLKDNSPRGTWELSDKGYQELGRLRNQSS